MFAFISNDNGINNIYLLDSITNLITPITNVFTGIKYAIIRKSFLNKDYKESENAVY